jgi:hypothetical protein
VAQTQDFQKNIAKHYLRLIGVLELFMLFITNPMAHLKKQLVKNLFQAPRFP